MGNAITTRQPAASVPAQALEESELITVLQNSLYPGANINSVRMVLAYCVASGLDPMQKPVHIVPIYDGKARTMRDVVMPGIGLYRTQAARSGEYAGVTEPEFGQDVTEKLGGVEITYPAWCRVTVKRLMANGSVAEFSATERWKENYAVKGGQEKSIAPNAMWSRRPYAQLSKCAEAQALRKAFPEIRSAPTADEMEGKEFDMPERVINQMPEEKTIPAYPQDKMDENMPAWKKHIAAGKQTPDQIIGLVSSKYILSDEQQKAIRALAKPANVDEDGVIDADFVAALEGATA
jgi:phage recombination protein Bet